MPRPRQDQPAEDDAEPWYAANPTVGWRIPIARARVPSADVARARALALAFEAETATLYLMELGEWTADALHRIENELRADPHWSGVLASRSTRTIHLAIFVQPFLGRVLDGTKVIESRFTVRRCAPFQRVWNGDIVLVKEAAGPVRAVCEVGTTWFFDLAPAPSSEQTKNTKLEEIRTRFGERICAPDEAFWESCEGTSYASLVELHELRLITPIACPKRDRRGWVVLHDREEEPPPPARRTTRLRSVPTW